jgi:N-carbamoylputrescine amidase
VWGTDLGIKVGVTICYDRHFPEGPRCLALNGADVLFVPTATPLGGEMWEIELRGHAIANLFWVGAVNRVGRDRGGFPLEFYGRSLWAAPNGELKAVAGTDGDEILLCEVDTDVSKHYRDAWGFFRDRRPEVYREVVAP